VQIVACRGDGGEVLSHPAGILSRIWQMPGRGPFTSFDGDRLSDNQPGTWRVIIPPSPAKAHVLDAGGALVATLEAPRNQASADAILVAYAPVMLDALNYCARAFTVIREEDPGPSGQVAQALMSHLEQLLQGPLGVWQDGPRQVAESRTED